MPAVLHWFRHDLRLHDNAALHASLGRAEREGLAWLPIWWAGDRWSGDSPWGIPRAGVHRQAFLNQALADLSRSLQAMGSGLLVLRDPSPQVLIDLARSVGAVGLVAEDIAAPDEQAEVAALEAKGLAVQTVWQSSLLDPADLPWETHAVPDVFTAFRQGVEHAGVRAHEPLPAPTRCPPWPEALACPPPWSEPEALPPGAIDARSSFPYGQAAWHGGETAALAHLAQYLARDLPHTYKITRNQLQGNDFSSKWSPWLASGALSPRAALASLRTFEAERGANEGSYWLWFELLWRDHFRFMHRKHGRRLYRAQGLSSRPEHRAPMHNDMKFAHWCAGETGEPLVDAGMRELHHTGFLSNRMRQIVASHWMHGLGGDWRAGAAWFESQLLDLDVHSNTGNWLYIAGRGTDPRGGRAFDVARQAQQHDPDGVYQAMWQ
ncbi:DASH family cryptochrome [Hydrogenophaga sp.]|uniref:DASH family cryptochrome n=1 Tax=Hydrogenophaga sp. TaxID=1904254 RepID=UPI0025B8ABAA|nr:DASH family cryptochrome [Hydrogenophaga sp.]